VHGGDVWQVGEELGIPAAELLDFSANINPRGLPRRAQERLARDASDSRLLSFYPDPSARRLRQALSGHLGVSPDAIAVGPGAEALLAPIFRAMNARRALIPVPAFSEYRRVCEQVGIQFVPFPLHRAELFRLPADSFRKRIEADSPDVVLVNNPHNPSGVVLQAGEARSVLDSQARLVLDEAFADYIPEISLAREASAHPSLIVLRSLTKFYGCPALRVGYAVAHPDIIRRIQGLLPTWAVTQLALDALAEALGDREYAAGSLRENATERARLAGLLNGLGLFVFPSAANYLFLELPEGLRASELRARLLANHAILIRNCDSYEGLETGRYIRVAVRSAVDNDRLIDSLARELKRELIQR
jgi:threonine-phosphate decarboxylase